jgi:hypothetical protein
MIIKTNIKYTTAIIAAVLSISTAPALAASVSITNSGFESDFDGWSDTDPSAISSDEYSGSKAAKITGTGGKFDQSVSISANTNYTLTAYIEGSGEIGASVNGTSYTSTGGGSNYEQVSVSFNSGSATSVTISGSYYGGEGRFDDFALNSSGGSTTTTDGELSIDTAFDDGSSHQNYPASNAVDDSTAWSSRWAANLGGDAVNLTVQLDDVEEVKQVGVAWGKGNTLTNTFEIYARPGTSGSWTKVYDSISSGSSTGIEVYDVTDIDAKQVRIKTQDNSSTSNWTNITEVKLYGSASTTTPNPTGSDIPSNITDGSLFDLEGDSPHPLVDSKTLEFVPLEAQITTENGNGWRHEYKIKSSERVAMTDTYEYFKANIKVDLSDGGKTIVAQHHASDTGTIMKLYIADSSESDIGESIPDNGIFGVYVRIRNTSGVEEKKALGTIQSGDSFSFEVINDYGVVSVTAFGETLETEVEDDSESYLKFGNYLQSQYPNGSVDCGEAGDSDSFEECYGDIGITTAKITMTDVSYTRISN